MRGAAAVWQIASMIAGPAGWCGIDAAGRLRAGAPAEATLDGVKLALRWSRGVARIPAGRRLVVSRAGVELLGSPIDLAAIQGVEGFVEAQGGGLSGWAWHPGDPGRDPVITIGGLTELVLSELRPQNDDLRPLARPRRFAIAADALPPGLVHVRGADGRDLLGSPVDPGLEARSAAGLAPGQWTPIWADVTPPANATPPVTRPVDVVIPVYGAAGQDPATTLACLDSVLASLPRGSRVHVVDDCSPDPVLTAALQALARRGPIRLHRQGENRGYPAAVNVGMQAAAGRDVVLLNSDTLVPPGWLPALAAAARSAPRHRHRLPIIQ